MKTAGVIIARFQTPYLHEGHRHLIETVQAMHTGVIIILGVSPVKCSKRNPFDYATREKMVKASYPSVNVLPLRDTASDAQWSIQLDQLLTEHFANTHFVLYGSRNSFTTVYSGQWPTQEIEEKPGYSATAIREKAGKEVLASPDFRAGINYACQNRYTCVYPTIDIALLNESRDAVLLGRKSGESGWRLPGGFADATDESYEAAAARELREECGNVQTGVMQYAGSCRVNDWRYRSESDKIMTLLYITQLRKGSPSAGDDLAEVKWFPLQATAALIENEQLVPEHYPLMRLLLNFL